MQQSPIVAPFEPVEVADPTLNRRQLSKLRTRAKVLDAARALFIERGYEAATVRDIAARAGMSTGAVFANFEDKADLFEAVLVEDYEKVAERMRAVVARPAPIVERLAATLGSGYAYHLDSLPLVQATASQSWLRPLAAELRARTALKVLLGIVGDALREAARNGEIRQDFDVRLVSEMLWDAYLANFRKAIYDGWSLDILQTRLSDQVAIVLGGLKAR